ncbi:MAG: hypothetical protein R3B54_02955 [Bdellovibrionota bacterium]
MGEQKGFAAGDLEGAAAGKRAGYDRGWKQGYARGEETGFVHGYEWGYEQARAAGYRDGSYEDGYRMGEAAGMDLAEKEAKRTHGPLGWEAARQEVLEQTALGYEEIDNANRWADEAPPPEMPKLPDRLEIPETRRLLKGAHAEKNLYALGLASPSAINSAAVGRTVESSALSAVVFVPENWPKQKVVPDFSADRVPLPLYTYAQSKRVFASREMQTQYDEAYRASYRNHFREAYKRVYARVADELFRNTYESQYALSVHTSFPEDEAAGSKAGYVFAFRLAFEKQNQRAFERAAKEAQSAGEADGNNAAYQASYRKGERKGKKMGDLSSIAMAYREGYESGEHAGYASRLPSAQKQAFDSQYNTFLKKREKGAIPEFVAARLRYTGGTLFAVDLLLQNLGRRGSEEGSLMAQVEGAGYDFSQTIVSLKPLSGQTESLYRNVFLGEATLEARGELRVIVFADGQLLGEQTLLPPQPNT